MKDQNENKLITEEYKDNDPDVKIFSDYQSKEENNLQQLRNFVKACLTAI